MLPLLKFSVLRIAVFVAILAIVAWAGASLLTALVVAALVSGLVSYLLLRGPREELATQIAQRLERRLPSQDDAAEDSAAPDSAVQAQAEREQG